MNLLHACFSRKGQKENVQLASEIYRDGILDLFVDRIPGYRYGKRKAYHNEESNTVTAMIGYLSNLDKICRKYGLEKAADVEIIDKLFKKVNTRFFYELEGVFTVFIWDTKNFTGYAFQDEFASNIPLYFTNNESTFCMSTSLKKILQKDMLPKRELNHSAVQDYIIERRTIPNDRTFIKGISKLIPHHYLMIKGNTGAFRLRKIAYPKPSRSLESAKVQLIEVVRNSIIDLHALLEPSQRTCSLSGGFDSNTILFFITKLADKVLAITIGGKKKNEIPNAMKLAEHYDNVKHETVYVSGNKLEIFPDIVWRTEGYVCESGLFLQYELANLLKNWGLNEMISGEGADQVMDQERKKFHAYHVRRDFRLYLDYTFRKRLWPQRYRESQLFKYIRKPSLKISFDGEIDYMLKKSGLISNSYGIQIYYPLLNRSMQEIGQVLGPLNASKNFYKQELRKVLGESRMAYINKAGGATDVEYLFEGYETVVLKLLDHDFIKPVLNGRRLAQVKEDPMNYSELIVRLFYLFVFNQLFITGKYDNCFQDAEFNIDFKTVVKDELGS